MVSLDFPWPPPQLSPNFKRANHWSAYRKFEKAAATLGWGLSVQALRGLPPPELPPGGKLKIYIRAQPPMRPGPLPDEDNFKASLKHYLDGIARALEINDRNFRFAEIEWLTKEGAGKVIIGF